MNGHSLNQTRGILFCLVVFEWAEPGRCAEADTGLGIYVGGGLGQSQVNAGIPLASVGAPTGTFDFKANHSAYKAMVGMRPISLLGAELEYLNFGHPSSTAGTATNDVSITGTGVFALLYLPVPLIDVFVKAGMGRLKVASTSLDLTVNCGVAVNPNCPYARRSSTTTDFAAGAGVQFKLGPWALRGEYEQFRAAGGNPRILSAGVTWTF